jgi:DNA-directed RNA polymerase subunit RPC12/RpoP
VTETCTRDDGRCRRCSHGCYEVVPCNRCGEEFRRSDMDDGGYCPDCADVVAQRRAAEEGGK